jgi:hypothetical protein
VSGGSLASATYVASILHGGRGLDSLDTRVTGDFLLPTLIGAMLPNKGRGAGIEEEWRQGPTALGDLTIGTLAARWREAKEDTVPPFPIPLFNSVSLDRHAVVLSPLARAHYWNPLVDDMARGPGNEYRRLLEERLGEAPTWVFYRGGIYGLDDLLQRYDPSLASSVRASANFPVGFPLVRVRTSSDLFYSTAPGPSPSGLADLYLTDGGALSNSGVWPLFHLLTARKEVLRERGVILVVVDAGRMPELDANVPLFRLLGTVRDKNPMGEAVHRLMFQHLGEAFGDRLALVQIGLIPTEPNNVLTTWALDSASIRTLDRSFADSWPAVRRCLEAEWYRLAPDSLIGREGETYRSASRSLEDACARSSRVPTS